MLVYTAQAEPAEHSSHYFMLPNNALGFRKPHYGWDVAYQIPRLVRHSVKYPVSALRQRMVQPLCR